MPPPESTARNFVVTAAVAVVCSLAVSLTAVGLRGRRDAMREEGRIRHVLEAAGLTQPRAYERIEERTVDLESGEYVPAAEADPLEAAALTAREDVAGIGTRERYASVFLVRDLGRVVAIVLPVRGQGWSMLKGYLCIESDLATVRGLTFHEHEETAGMGAEVDNPAWKALWRGKRLRDAGGRVRIRLVKGGVAPGSATAAYEVDAISGASLTSEGVENLLRFWLGARGFGPYLDLLAKRGVDHG